MGCSMYSIRICEIPSVGATIMRSLYRVCEQGLYEQGEKKTLESIKYDEHKVCCFPASAL